MGADVIISSSCFKITFSVSVERNYNWVVLRPVYTTRYNEGC